MKKKKILVIVESPSKMKTIKKFLDSNYSLESSVGHIRDLPQKEFGIDLEHDFEPKYVTMADKKEVVQKLKDAANKADIVYLATDPDREGEAIAWHISYILPKDTEFKRITFNSITKKTVHEALAHPRDIDLSLVNAQQARRILDRMVGYTISPLLTRRVKRGRNGTSAGRVQSVALKLVVDREKEIDAFTPIEYWTIRALLSSDNQKTFQATLFKVDGKKIEKEEKKDSITIPSKEVADSIAKRAKKAKYSVKSIEKKEKKRYPVPPFITSTLQQEASRHYGFSVARTMSVAQQLYEGIDMGKEGTEGLITYMRTDSVQIAPEALSQAREHIESNFGKEYLPEHPIVYKSKKTAQEAHEAIRPTNLSHPPEMVKEYLNPDQFKIYLLIFRRFISSQMNPAIYDTVLAEIDTDQNLLFRATGSILKFRGYLAAYEEKTDQAREGEEDDELTILPPLEENMALLLKDLLQTQSFTKAPPRFTEASLIKELEKSGIGRPSTFASIMNKIQSREYTLKENKALKPTDLGKVIAQMLEDNFSMIMDIGFTAQMEDQLELVATNEKNWKQLLAEFWKDFFPLIEKAEKDAIVPKVTTDIDCPKCGSKLQKIWSRDRYFYGCSRYPDCDYTTTQEALEFKKEDYDPNFNWDQKCPTCSSDMILRHGRFGPFLGCTKYPDCRGIVNIPKNGEEALNPEDQPNCPAVGCDGKIMMRKSRFGKTFYSCSNYPDCDVIVNQIDQLEEKYQNHPKTPYVKKAKGRKGTKKGTTTPTKTKRTKKTTVKKSQPTFLLSDELSSVVGEKELSRQQVLKKLWEYIKEHKCQDPKNGRLIVPDKKLAKLFGSSNPVDMMKLASVIKDHLKKE